VTGLKEGQEVLLTIWQLTDLGAKVIVNNRFSGLLYRDELGPRTSPGDRLTGYVKRIRDDGKVDVTLRQSGAAGVEADKATLLSALRKSGFLPLHDNSPPEAIRQDLGMSKRSFKKAAGGLYKEGVIELTGEGIRLKKMGGEK
jgi:predicted RNA-binding protein (virulence factor B family)